MSDSSSICLSCLLCCDGTLIGFVQLEQEEIPPLKALLDIEKIQMEAVFFFILATTYVLKVVLFMTIGQNNVEHLTVDY